MRHSLPELPYAKTALEPHVSAETLEFHHDKHHAKYVATTNELIEGTKFAEASLEEIIRKADGPLFNNAAQAWNHSFYWRCLSPSGGGVPEGALAKAIQEQFNSFEEFKQEFTSAGTSLFGSGWVWLASDEDGRLQIQQGGNADTPIRQKGFIPMLTCDVWEHAYYIDYRNARPKYLDAFWNIVNWEFAAEQYQELGSHATA
jgi:Fe-Mn family superoxide dismutase